MGVPRFLILLNIIHLIVQVSLQAILLLGIVASAMVNMGACHQHAQVASFG